MEDITQQVEKAVWNLYKKGVETRAEHSTPSPETLKMINKLEVNMSEQQKDIGYIKEKIEDTNNILRDFIDECGKKFASKLTEYIVYGLCGMILVGFITAIITFFIKGAQF